MACGVGLFYRVTRVHCAPHCVNRYWDTSKCLSRWWTRSTWTPELRVPPPTFE